MKVIHIADLDRWNTVEKYKQDEQGIYIATKIVSYAQLLLRGQ